MGKNQTGLGSLEPQLSSTSPAQRVWQTQPLALGELGIPLCGKVVDEPRGRENLGCLASLPPAHHPKPLTGLFEEHGRGLSGSQDHHPLNPGGGLEGTLGVCRAGRTEKTELEGGVGGARVVRDSATAAVENDAPGGKSSELRWLQLASSPWEGGELLRATTQRLPSLMGVCVCVRFCGDCT